MAVNSWIIQCLVIWFNFIVKIFYIFCATHVKQHIIEGIYLNINNQLKEVAKDRVILAYMSFFAVLNIILLIALGGIK